MKFHPYNNNYLIIIIEIFFMYSEHFHFTEYLNTIEKRLTFFREILDKAFFMLYLCII